MFNSNFSFRILFLLFFFLSGLNNNGATLTAADVSYASVNAKLAEAVAGDTIIIPEGNATWTSQLVITKPIHLQGSGTNKTIIIEAIPTANKSMIYIHSLGNNLATVSHLWISNTTESGSSGNILIGKAYSAGSRVVDTNVFRIHHVRQTLLRRGVGVKGYASGVVDHCLFETFPPNNQQQGVSVWGINEMIWEEAIQFGSTNGWTYVEDNVFDWRSGIADSAMDAYGGGRYVARFNTTYNVGFGDHGLDSGSYRSPHGWEIYGNTYYTAYGFRAPRALGEIRGGTGMIYSNACFRDNTISPKNFIDTRYARASFGDAINVVNATDGLPPFQFVAGKRTVTDAYITSGSTTLISTQAQFRYYRDYKIRISGTGIPAGTYNNTTDLNGQTAAYIHANASATTITMSQPATQTINGGTVTFYNPYDNITNTAAGVAPYDQADASYGWPCPDQIGRTGPSVPSFWNTSGDPPDGYVTQASQPAYQWANTMTQISPAPPATFTIGWRVDDRFTTTTDNQSVNHPNMHDIIQIGRDCINWDGSSSSNGYPPLVQGGWYVPLVYPHPLVSGVPESPINSNPTITSISDQITNKNSVVGPISFTITDEETAAGSLTLTATSSDDSIITTGNISFSGSGENRTVSLTPENNALGDTTIVIRVTDADGGFDEISFVVTFVEVGNGTPIISSISNTSGSRDTVIGPVSFTVNDAETAAGSLSVTATSSDTTLLPNANITLGGSGVNRTITMQPVARRSGRTLITVTVEDAGELTATTTFYLTVDAESSPMGKKRGIRIK